MSIDLLAAKRAASFNTLSQIDITEALDCLEEAWEILRMMKRGGKGGCWCEMGVKDRDTHEHSTACRRVEQWMRRVEC